METDRLPEERRRGISIALGFAHLRLGGDAEIDIIDMPGHERFVRTMVSGATGIDAVMLVIAANEGVKPQTVEHIDIAVLLGLTRALIVVTKSDLVTPAEAADAARHAAAFAVKAGLLLAAPPILTSAVAGTGVDAVRRAIGGLLDKVRPQADAGFAYLPVDRAFTIAGHGTVVTGTLRHGRLDASAETEMLPSGLRARIRSLQVHGTSVGGGGTRPARGGQPARRRGRCGARAAPRCAIPVCCRRPTGFRCGSPRCPAPPHCRPAMRLSLLFGTDEVDVRLRLLDREPLEPGQTALAQLHCGRPVSVPARERFILRVPSPVATVAGGLVLDPATRRQRRHAPRTNEHLAALRRCRGRRYPGRGGGRPPVAPACR